MIFCKGKQSMIFAELLVVKLFEYQLFFFFKIQNHFHLPSNTRSKKYVLNSYLLGNIEHHAFFYEKLKYHNYYKKMLLKEKYLFSFSIFSTEKSKKKILINLEKKQFWFVSHFNIIPLCDTAKTVKSFSSNNNQTPQLYKNRFCGLVVIPEVFDDIRSKCGTFDWLMAN